MKITTVKNMASEIYTPITPAPVWTPLTKPLEECTVGFASACGVHLKTQKPYKLAGDGRYDHTDVNRDINSMWPYQRMIELEREGFIKHFCDINAGFMGGGGDIDTFTNQIGPEVAELFVSEGADIVILTAG